MKLIRELQDAKKILPSNRLLITKSSNGAFAASGNTWLPHIKARRMPIWQNFHNYMLSWRKNEKFGGVVRGLTSIYEWYSIQFASEERLKMIIILIIIKELPICMKYNTACILFHVEFIWNEIVERPFINLLPKRHLLVRCCSWGYSL